MKEKVAIISKGIWPQITGGAELVTYKVTQELQRKGYNVSLINKEWECKESRPEMSTIIDWAWAEDAARKAMAVDPDVIYISQYWWEGAAHFINDTYPVVLMIHDLGFLEVELDPEMRHQMMGAWHKSINRAQKLIVAGKRNQDMLFETFPQAKEKTILIPLGVELPANVAPHASSNKIVYVGRITRYKGIHCLIKAFQEVSRVFPEAELHIYGQISTGLGDYHQELLSLLRKIGIKKINYVPKWFSEEEKIRMIQEAGVVVYPSIGSEGFGIGPLEGLGINGVVVASDVFEETGVISRDVAFVYPSHSTQELTQQLIKAMSLSPEDKALQREKASRWVANFTWERHVDALEEVFKSLWSRKDV